MVPTSAMKSPLISKSPVTNELPLTIVSPVIVMGPFTVKSLLVIPSVQVKAPLISVLFNIVSLATVSLFNDKSLFIFTFFSKVTSSLKLQELSTSKLPVICVISFLKIISLADKSRVFRVDEYICASTVSVSVLVKWIARLLPIKASPTRVVFKSAAPNPPSTS